MKKFWRGAWVGMLAVAVLTGPQGRASAVGEPALSPPNSPASQGEGLVLLGSSEGPVAETLDAVAGSADGPLTAGRVIQARQAVIRLGPAALPDMVAYLRGAQGADWQRFAVFQAILQLDRKLRLIGDLLDLFLQEKAPRLVRIPAAEKGHWDRYLNCELDLRDYLSAIVLTDGQVEAIVSRFTADHTGPKYTWLIQHLSRPAQRRVLLGILSKAAAQDADARTLDSMFASAVGLARYAGGEDLRRALRKVAENPDGGCRADAVLAWAEMGTRADYDAALAMIKPLADHVYPPPSACFRALEALDYKRAKVDFARYAEDITRDIGDPPWSDSYWAVLKSLGTQEQFVKACRDAAESIRAGNPRVPRNGVVQYQLLNAGFRDIADLVRDNTVPTVHQSIEWYRRCGMDIEELAKKALTDKTGRAVVLLFGEDRHPEWIPDRLVARHKDEIIAAIEKVLDSAPGPQQGLDPEQAGLDQELRQSLMVAMVRTDPTRLEKHTDILAKTRPHTWRWYLARPSLPAASAEAVRQLRKRLAEPDDVYDYDNLMPSLLELEGPTAIPFCKQLYDQQTDREARLHIIRQLRKVDPPFAWAELAGMLDNETRPARRFEIARSLAYGRTELPADVADRVKAELLPYLKLLPANEREDLAAVLALRGNKEAAETFDRFLTGQSARFEANFHYPFSTLALFVQSSPPRMQAQARDYLIAAISRHPDAMVGGEAIQMAARCAGADGARGPDGKGFPIVDCILDRLTSTEDWQVRMEAGLVARLLFQDVRPEWDYDHFWPNDRLDKAAGEIRQWWQANHDRLAWRASPWSDYGEGDFVFSK